MNVAVLIAAMATGQAGGGDVHGRGVDCGTAALYVLARLEGRPVSFEDTRAALPPTPARGHSMLALRDAAGRLGLRLRGVRYDGLEALDRPILAFLDRQPHGHFVVVRPVGHSGRLVQLFDGPDAPRVLDADRLAASTEWTGLVLRPSRPPLRAAVAGALALVLSVAAGIGCLVRRRTQSRRARTVAP